MVTELRVCASVSGAEDGVPHAGRGCLWDSGEDALLAFAFPECQDVLGEVVACRTVGSWAVSRLQWQLALNLSSACLELRHRYLPTCFLIARKSISYLLS